jgi:non-specific serine/threonine protein kinase/serine/threonine-protein kinase
MDHPGIAKVFDAGSTPEGRPYFAMELVRGEPITTYSARHALPLRARLHLFLDVCDAVQHAHQKGVIHRDLKPSNVLVEGADGRARPTIIDFGIAKATTRPLTDATLHTELGSVVGTPEYMSPEQAELGVADVDTRTDVYALGTILHELLTGVLPLDIPGARQRGIDEVRRTIREVHPARPSTRVGAKALRGDLDWITLKALEKERARRYGSVAELAADLRRHLEHQPVVAGPPTVAYRTGKFLRRHRLGVSIAGAAVVLLVGFAATTAMQARRIAQERDRANVEAEAARETAAFLTGLFTVSDPSEARGDTLTATQILDKGAAEIDRTLMDQPGLRARLQTTIGVVFTKLGRYSAAEPLLQDAEATLRKTAGPDNPATLAAMTALADLRWNQERFSEALAVYEPLIESLRLRFGPDHRSTLKARFDLASTYVGLDRLDDAVRLNLEVLDRQRRVLGPNDADTVSTLGNLSFLHMRMGQYDQALPLAREVVDRHTKVLGPDHPETLTGLHNLAATLDRLGSDAEAEQLYERAVAARRRVLGDDHPAVASTRFRYAQMRQRQKKFDAAEALLLAAYGSLTTGASTSALQRAGQIVDQLVSLYTDWGKPARAAEWRARAASK